MIKVFFSFVPASHDLLPWETLPCRMSSEEGGATWPDSEQFQVGQTRDTTIVLDTTVVL